MLILHEVEQVVRNPQNRFAAVDAGTLSSEAFARLKEAFGKRDIKATYEFYIIANYLRNKYILQEKQRLIDNASRLGYILDKSRQQLDSVKQQRAMGRGFEELGEATLLWKTWLVENHQTPAFRSFGSQLESRYRVFETQLAALRSERRNEEQAEFKEIKYAIGMRGGVFYSISEEFPPYTASYLYGYDEKGIPDTTTYPVSDGENTATNSQGFIGYVLAINASYYIQDNVFIELDLSYGKMERERPRVHPFFGSSFYIPEYASPLSYTTIGFTINYLLRIKTGFRSFSGIGGSFTTSYAPESRSYVDSRYPYSLYQFSASPAGYSESMRAILRTGIEFIPSNNSLLSYSFVVDGSLALTSLKNISPLLLLSYFRINLLL